MSTALRSGAELTCRGLAELGVEYVFGVPGTQNVELYEAVRRSSVRSILTTHELGATFMANGYARASGHVGVVLAIPGPGFAYTLPGLAEAKLDSVPLLLITGEPAPAPGRAFRNQAIDQRAIARPLVKEVVEVERAEQLAPALARAYHLTREGEPGPVVLQVSARAMSDRARETSLRVGNERERDDAALAQVAARLREARRPLILAGQGVEGAAADLRHLVEQWGVPVATTPSGRGVLPENHPLALCFDPVRGNVASLNELVHRADLVLAVGCKLGHNGTAGFALDLPVDRLIHVDSARTVLEANYATELVACARSERLFAELRQEVERHPEHRTAWSASELAAFRDRLRTPAPERPAEPRLSGVPGGTAAAFFAALRRALPDDGLVVTDTGLHQILTRRYYEVRAPHGLLFPSDFQSMGFGVPAAIGAKLAAPERPVVAVVGDGGLVMAGMEILTAAREDLPVVIVVFQDGQLNQIRLQQLAEFGHAHDVSLRTPDLASFAQAVGARYEQVSGDPDTTLRTALAVRGPVIVEVSVGDSPGIRAMQLKGLARHTARRALGPAVTAWIKRRVTLLRAATTRGRPAPSS